MREHADAGRSYRQGKRLIWVTILACAILLVPPMIVFCDRDQPFFSFAFLMTECLICMLGSVASLVICYIIRERHAPFSQKVIGPDDLLRPLRYAVQPCICLGLASVAFVAGAAAFVVSEDGDIAMWLGFPRLSWALLFFAVFSAVPMIAVIIKNSRAMSRIMEGSYSVYLAEFTRGDSDADPDSHAYYMYFEKAEDERPRMFTTSDYGKYGRANPGDRYYLLVVGRDIVNALGAADHVLCEEFKDRLIVEQSGVIS